MIQRKNRKSQGQNQKFPLFRCHFIFLVICFPFLPLDSVQSRRTSEEIMHDYESNPIPHQFDSKPKQENSTTQTPTPPPLLRELDLSEYQDLEAVDDLKSQELEYMITPSFNQITLKQEVLSESPFPLGCIISPFPELSEEIPTIYHEPTRCTSCGAIPTNLSQVDVEKNSYKCSICGKINGNLSLSNIQKKEDSQPSDNDHHFSLEENHSKAKVKHDECYYIDQSGMAALFCVMA